MSDAKLMGMDDAIQRFVTDGSAVAMGLGLETAIPFAAGHEMIRQRKRDLTLIGPISDILFDQLIGAGCVRKVRAAWVGNVITGSGYHFRRAVESASIVVEDHSNLTLMTALRAGAAGLPFMPTLTGFGSDLFRSNDTLKPMHCPFSGQAVMAVAAIRPDTAVVAVQRADVNGNAHAWGSLGVTREACLASRQVILVAEEIVSAATIRSDPNRVLVPGFRVSAVVEESWSAHPSPMPGYYNRDHDSFLEYRDATRTLGGAAAWQRRWVDDVPSRTAYRRLLGEHRMQALGLRQSAPSVPVDYGY